MYQLCITVYITVYQKLYVPNDICTPLFADANVHIQLYMLVYNCVSILMSVKSCIYPIIHIVVCRC